MSPAVITFDFDPFLHLFDGFDVRWQTLALAAVIVACLVVAAGMARRMDLRADDLLYIVVGAVPGAVVLGRIGYGIAHADTFSRAPLRLLDPATAGLDLALGVVGGIAAGVYVASLLGSPIGRWAHLAALPLLVAIAAGKLTMVLGGSGQGLPSDATWATAYLPPGPWVSLAPALPSVPSQAMEGFATLGWALALAIGTALVGVGRRDGSLLLVGVAGWAFLRAGVSVTWRDPPVAGPFGMAGWITIAVGVGAVAALLVLLARRRGAPADDGTDPASAEPAWPDPEARPRF